MDPDGESPAKSAPTPEQLGVGDARRWTVAGRQLGAGALAGLGAWTAVYAVIFFLYQSELEGEIISQAVDTSRIVGLLMYNAHTVSVEVVQPFNVDTHDFLAAGGASLVPYLLPPIALALAGLLVAVRMEPSAALVPNVTAGATVVVGYSLCALAGIALFTTTSGDTQFRPDPAGAILLAGILYPLAFGALGGAAASFVRASQP